VTHEPTCNDIATDNEEKNRSIGDEKMVGEDDGEAMVGEESRRPCRMAGTGRMIRE
jgi:hypothetical protein